MKKFFLKTTLASVIASLVAVTGVYAATTSEVLTLEAVQDGITGTINFSGTTDPGVLAVACSLLDSSDTEIIFGSTSVNEKAFSGEIVMPVADYTLKCANYDGGVWVSAVIVKQEATAEETTTESPETGTFTVEESASATSNSTPVVVAAITVGIIAIVSTIVLAIKRRKAKSSG